MPLWAAVTFWFWGLLMWLSFWGGFKWRIKARHWPTIPGRILDREQHFLYHARGGRVGEPGRDIYAGTISYTYTVNGVSHTSASLYPNEKARGDRAELEYIFQKLPEEPPVHYNPENPAQSFLLFPRLDKVILAFLASMLFFGIGIGGYAGLLFQPKPTDPTHGKPARRAETRRGPN